LAHSVFGCWSFGFNQKQFSQNKDAVIININTEVAWCIANEPEGGRCLVGKSGDIGRQRNHLLSLALLMFMSFFACCSRDILALLPIICVSIVP
jgi:hypothetical protein